MACRPRKPKSDNWDVRGAPHEILQQESNQNPTSFRVLQGPYDRVESHRWQFDRMQPMQSWPTPGAYRDNSHSMSGSYPPASVAAPFGVPTIANNVQLHQGLEASQLTEQRYVTNSGLDTIYETPPATQSYASPDEPRDNMEHSYAPVIQDFSNQHSLLYASNYSHGVGNGGNYANERSTALVGAGGTANAAIYNLDMVGVGQGWEAGH